MGSSENVEDSVVDCEAEVERELVSDADFDSESEAVSD